MGARVFLLLLAFTSCLDSSRGLAMSRKRLPPLGPVEDSWSKYYPLRPASAARPVQPGQTILRAMTLNVRGLPLPFMDLDRLKDIGSLLNQSRLRGEGPDVVAIQEGFSDRTEELIRASGYPYVAYGPQGHDTRARAGILILSRYPITKTQTVKYTNCISWDCMTHKGVQFARIRIPGAPSELDVYNTHINSNPETDPTITYEDVEWMRSQQVQEIREFLWDTRTSHAPALFLGDFNLRPHYSSYDSFLAFISMFDAAADCSSRFRCTGAPAQAIQEDYRQSIDRQFYASGTAPRMTLTPVRFQKVFSTPHRGRPLSDHSALLIHYRVQW